VVRRFHAEGYGRRIAEMARVRKGLDLLRRISTISDASPTGATGWPAIVCRSPTLPVRAHHSAVDYIGDVPWADFSVRQSVVPTPQIHTSYRPLLTDSVRACRHRSPIRISISNFAFFLNPSARTDIHSTSPVAKGHWEKVADRPDEGSSARAKRREHSPLANKEPTPRLRATLSHHCGRDEGKTVAAADPL
jgi:hypothetical protein